jgi:DNA-binding Lrp family transcriptional regulator
MKIDELDKEILGVLQSNSRLSLRKIAQLLEVSTTTVSDRVEKLKKSGVIKRFTVQIDPDELGLHCSLLVLIEVAPGNDMERVAGDLKKIQEVCNIYRITGEFDFMLLTRASDRHKAMQILNKISDVDGITAIESSWILETVKETPFHKICLT